MVGIEPRDGTEVKLPVGERLHLLCTGFPGTGKSTFFLSQMLQDIERGDSVFLFDPHGDLARRLLTHISKKRWGDVVYVNPLTAWDHSRVVRFNFLEMRRGLHEGLVTRMFMDALKKNYPGFWGPRLDAIMTHAIYLLFDVEKEATLPKLGKVLSSVGWREGLLDRCDDEEIKRFWRFDFPNMPDFAVTAAQTKLYEIMTEKVLKPMTSATKSTIDFYSLMNEGKIVIINLPEGALTSTITGFLGSMLLSQIYQAGMARERVPEEERRIVHVYVDEAHRFITEILRDNMQALRKYNVFLSVASQYLQQYSREVQNDIPQLANTHVAFASGKETSMKIEEFFSSRLGKGRFRRAYESLMRTPEYLFYLSVPIGGIREVFLVKTIDPGIGPTDPDEVVRHSLGIYGEEYSVVEGRAKRIDIPYPGEITPVEYFLLSYLDQHRQTPEGNLMKSLKKRYKFPETATDAALSKLYMEGKIDYKERMETADRREARKLQKFFWITDAGLQLLYPRWSGPRMGGYAHIFMICRILYDYRLRGYYPKLATGKEADHETVRVEEKMKGKVELWPDVLVYPMERGESYSRDNLGHWDKARAFPVEVEAYPTGSEFSGSHLDRTKAHFRAARDRMERPVVFAVKCPEDAAGVERAIKEEGAEIVADIMGRHVQKGAAEIYTIKWMIPSKKEFQSQLAEVRKFAEDANVSHVAEPEDFVGDEAPDYANRQGLSEIAKRKNGKLPAGGVLGGPAPELEEKVEAEPEIKIEPAEPGIRKGEPLAPPPEKAHEGWTPQRARQFETTYHQGRRRVLRKRHLVAERKKAIKEKELRARKIKAFPVSAPQKEKLAVSEPPTVPGPTDRRQPLLLGAQKKKPTLKAFERIKELSPEEEVEEKHLRMLVDDGWTLRVRNMKSGARLTARKRVNGVRKEKYIGTYNEKIKKVLERLGLSGL